MKLTRTQQELLDTMKTGVTLFYMPYLGRFNPTAYYFRTDNHKRCTAAAQALLDKGLLEKYDDDWRGHRLRFKAAESLPHSEGSIGAKQAENVVPLREQSGCNPHESSTS